MNNITIAGRIGKEPEMRYLQDGTAVLGFSLADGLGKDKPTIWWRCSLFGKRAESLEQYITRGSPVTVSGNVTEREYTDKDGNQRKAMEVRVQDIALQGGRQQDDGGQRQPAPRQQAPQRQQRPAPQQNSSGFDDMEDDIPF